MKAVSSFEFRLEPYLSVSVRRWLDSVDLISLWRDGRGDGPLLFDLFES